MVCSLEYMDITLLIPILVVCILLEGFFSGSEIALVNADRYKLVIASDAGSKQAALALRMLGNSSRFFSTTLFGTNISTVTSSVVATLFIIHNFGEAYTPFALLVWPFALVFGEILPKSIFQHQSDRIVIYIAPILYVFSIVFFPFTWLLSGLTEKIIGRVKPHHSSQDRLTREELEMMIEVGRVGTSDVRQSERTMISRLFDLADKKVENIMTPLLDVIVLPVGASRKDADDMLAKHGFSRIPIYEGQAFNVVGLLHGLDLIFGDPDAKVRDLMHPVYYVPEEMPLDELLVAMKRRGDPLAVVVDEYGAATGIVTLEDLMEEVVGEISDEHDREPILYQRMGRNRYILSGRLEIEHANQRLKLDIPEGDYETMAGFVIHHLEKIPSVDEKFRVGDLEFKILRATDRAVLDIEVVKRG